MLAAMRAHRWWILTGRRLRAASRARCCSAWIDLPPWNGTAPRRRITFGAVLRFTGPIFRLRIAGWSVSFGNSGRPPENLNRCPARNRSGCPKRTLCTVGCIMKKKPRKSAISGVEIARQLTVAECPAVAENRASGRERLDGNIARRRAPSSAIEWDAELQASAFEYGPAATEAGSSSIRIVDDKGSSHSVLQVVCRLPMPADRLVNSLSALR